LARWEQKTAFLNCQVSISFVVIKGGKHKIDDEKMSEGKKRTKKTSIENFF